MNSGVQKFTKKFLRLKDRYNGRCGYCGKDVSPDEFAVDHIIPRAKGGSSDEANLMFCCCSCNFSKHARSLDEFRDSLIIKNSPLAGAIQAHHYRKLVEMGVDFSGLVDADFSFHFEIEETRIAYEDCHASEVSK